MSEFPSFLRLNNIPLYAYTTFCLSSHLWMDVGCFHLLAIVNNATVSTGEQFLSETLLSLLLGIYPEVELLGHMVVLFLSFWETTILLPTEVTPLYIPGSGVQGVPTSLHPHQHLLLSVFLLCFVFDSIHPKGCEVVSHWGFDLHFLDD